MFGLVLTLEQTTLKLKEPHCSTYILKAHGISGVYLN